MIYRDVKEWCTLLWRGKEKEHYIIADTKKRALNVIKRNRTFNKIFKDNVFTTTHNGEGVFLVGTPNGLKRIIILEGKDSHSRWAIKGKNLHSVLILRDNLFHADVLKEVATNLAFSNNDYTDYAQSFGRQYEDLSYKKEFGNRLHNSILLAIRGMAYEAFMLEQKQKQSTEPQEIVHQPINKPSRPKKALPSLGDLGSEVSQLESIMALANTAPRVTGGDTNV